MIRLVMDLACFYLHTAKGNLLQAFMMARHIRLHHGIVNRHSPLTYNECKRRFVNSARGINLYSDMRKLFIETVSFPLCNTSLPGSVIVPQCFHYTYIFELQLHRNATDAGIVSITT